jgi:YHS domain-containing protein
MVALVIALAGLPALADEEKTQTEETPEGGAATTTKQEVEAVEKAEDTYPLDTCIVSDGKLGSMGDPVVYDHDGREIRFCCKGCIGAFEKDPKTYLEKMDKAIIKKQLPDYPLETCLVMGHELASEKETPVNYVYDNQLIRFCCAACIKTFEKDPDKYLKKIGEAKAKRAAKIEHEAQMKHEGHMEQKEHEGHMKHMEHEGHGHMTESKATKHAAVEPYPLSTCIVSGEELGSMGDPVTHVYEGQELKFCCAGCIGQFKEDPEKYIKQMKAAGAAAAKESQGTE